MRRLALARAQRYLARLCRAGRPFRFCLSAAETKPRVALGGVVGCRCRRCFWALTWCGRQGARFVAVDRRHCIRMPFEPPCLMCNLSILHKKMCDTWVCARQKPDKRYERCRAARQASWQQVFKSRQDESAPRRMTSPAVRPKNGAARFAVLPSVELRAALLRQGRILKPWNKSARQNGPRKG